MLRGLAILFGVVGVLALTDGVLTLVWQEPVSGLLARMSQRQLAGSLNALEHQRPTPADEAALSGLPTDQQRMAYFASTLQQTARPGQAVGRIVIPRIGANFVVVAGTSTASLRKGPGIYSGTSVPGLPGTVGIAGHRTTYLAPFRRINELATGDLMTLQMPYGVFTYTVTGHKIVAPNNISVLRPTGYAQVVLTACNPLYSAAQRLAVFARLTSSVPTGFALGRSVPQTPAGAARVIAGAQFVPSLLGAAPPTQSAPFASVDVPVPVSQTDAIVVGPTTISGQQALAAAGRTSHVRRVVAAPKTVRSSAPGPSTPVIRTPPEITAPSAPITAPSAPVTITPTSRPSRPVTPTRPSTHSSPAPSNTTTKPSATPTSPTPPTSSTTGQTQTRVQGQPGGPAPIIGTSG